MDKIKLFTDFEKVKEAPHFGYVFPLVEYLYKNNELILDYYEVVDVIEEANYVALPLAVEYLWQNGRKKYYYDLLALAKKHNKKLLLFTSGDSGKTITDTAVITIRLGGYKSKLPENTFIMSPFFDDPITDFNLEFYTLNKTDKPAIGFVGHSAAGLLKWTKEFLVFVKGNLKRFVGKESTDFQIFYPSSIKRFHFLKKMEGESALVTNFIHRQKYRAGSRSKEDRLRTTLEFFNNIQTSPFTFCMRGAGNFSVRFYETLALGRIPVIVNTDIILPFSDRIDWGKHCVLVEENFADFILKVTEFYQSISEADFEKLQQENRSIWEKYFTKEGYFITFHAELKKQLL